MGFPDRIEREVDLQQPPAVVWAALTTAEGLASWFGDTAEIDLRPGGAGLLTWAGGDRGDFTVQRVEEPVAFGFTWGIYGLPDDDPRRTYVEFTLEARGDGTRLRVVETGFAQLPEDAHKVAFDGNVNGWSEKLAALTAHVG
ncbi:SRPBCC domain-containing protein [Actinokineospora guangxiensis]|uniref:SRPBCC domain-containing protein n=1 Tax=Actinokineospora guangxiensis TaxID=1490288 RepID=A0ABW0EVW0_9PSEU